MVKIFITLLLIPHLTLAYKYNLAVCAIFKDCAPFLKEWIEYHRMLGVEHFYLYDNSSTDHPETVLAHYVSEEVVTVFDWPNKGKNCGKINYLPG